MNTYGKYFSSYSRAHCKFCQFSHDPSVLQ